MHQVVVGVPAEGLAEANAARCVAAAKHLRWDGERLFIKGHDGEAIWVGPWRERKGLINAMATELGFPGGKRLYALAKIKYYWTSMLRDCIRWCSEAHPNQVEATNFKPPAHLNPTKKDT